MKKCFKCGVELELSEFYKHKRMSDGHLGKCKSCTKLDAKRRYDLMVDSSPGFIEKERKRGREKYRRLYVGTGKSDPKSNLLYSIRYPEKKKALSASGKMQKPFDGAEKHHWSYNEEHYKDVIWLTKREHGKAHRFIVYDQERMMYRRCDNNQLLDTKISHEQYIRDCILNKED